MPISRNNSGNLSRRQAFNGKGLTFVEVIFDDAITGSATTPEAFDSTFQLTAEVVNKNGTLLAQSYYTARKATDDDASEAAAIDADDSIDTYQFIVEGTPGQYNAADSAGDINMDVDATVIADAEADLETDILAQISVGDSAGNVHVKVRHLPADGISSSGAQTIYGMFDQRGAA